MKRNQREEELKRAIKLECHKQVDDLLKLTDPDTGERLLDVLMAHMAIGYGINVSIQVRHPEEEGRAEEDPSLKPQLVT